MGRADDYNSVQVEQVLVLSPLRPEYILTASSKLMLGTKCLLMRQLVSTRLLCSLPILSSFSLFAPFSIKPGPSGGYSQACHSGQQTRVLLPLASWQTDGCLCHLLSLHRLPCDYTWQILYCSGVSRLHDAETCCLIPLQDPFKWSHLLLANH